MSRTFTGSADFEFPEFRNPPNDPIAMLRRWFEGAEEGQVREPNAVTLSTATRDGVPSSRTVLLKAVTERGLSFGTSASSHKGRDLHENPIAAMTVYWRETTQQIRVTGTVLVESDEASDRMFAERPRDARASAAASRQSEPLDSYEALAARANELFESDDEIPRPDWWHAYLIQPLTIEFWHGRDDRMHRRLEYSRPTLTAPWTWRLLQP